MPFVIKVSVYGETRDFFFQGMNQPLTTDLEKAKQYQTDQAAIGVAKRQFKLNGSWTNVTVGKVS